MNSKVLTIFELMNSKVLKKFRTYELESLDHFRTYELEDVHFLIYATIFWTKWKNVYVLYNNWYKKKFGIIAHFNNARYYPALNTLRIWCVHCIFSIPKMFTSTKIHIAHNHNARCLELHLCWLYQFYSYT